MEATVEVSDDEIKDYVKDAFTPDEIYSKQDMIDYVSSNCDVEEVFSRKALEQWSLENGYQKEE